MPASLTDRADLIHIWQVLEALTVSLDRIGMYAALHGDAAAQAELFRWIGPGPLDDIAAARGRLTRLLLAHDPYMDSYLEYLAETAISYWEAPGTLYQTVFSSNAAPDEETQTAGDV